MSQAAGYPHWGIPVFNGDKDLMMKSIFFADSGNIRTTLRAPSLISAMYLKSMASHAWTIVGAVGGDLDKLRASQLPHQRYRRKAHWSATNAVSRPGKVHILRRWPYKTI